MSVSFILAADALAQKLHIYVTEVTALMMLQDKSIQLYDPAHSCSKHAPVTAGVGRASHVILVLGHRLVMVAGLQPMWVGFGDQLQCKLNAFMTPGHLSTCYLSPMAVALDGQLYILGGSSAISVCHMPWVHHYDSQAKCWNKLEAMPRPYKNLVACVLQLPVSLKCSTAVMTRVYPPFSSHKSSQL
ncbi:Kelch-like protein 22 [Labeo rohita]|uniref:Kelch-like protein 22 n=1 Tax=Labeo rohita TaxID=84645 RepID=A0ABQ8LA67_LABRO|nr:Kelch-like protein 22 [Labeo rohita]